MARKLSFTQYYQIGQRHIGDLDTNYTVQEIADEMGMTKSQVSHLCVLALGKLIVGFAELNGLRIRG